jgi:glycosyltransferase involved in cell wall biosynthesis
MTREVLFLVPDGAAPRGGIGRNVAHLIEALRRRADSPPVRIVQSWEGVWEFGINPRSLARYLRAVGAVAWGGLSGRVALLHLPMASRGSIVRKGLLTWLGWLLGIPVVLHVYSSYIEIDLRRAPRPIVWLVGATLGRAAAVIALGPYWRDFLVRHLGLDPARIAVIPPGAPDPGAPSREPTEASVQLLFVGQLCERKGTDVLLRALADDRLAAHSWRLVMAGDGYIEEMKRLAQALGIGDRCEFAGWLDSTEVQQLLAESDIFVLPSRAEGLSVAVLEAMAAGLPIVTTPVGALADAIRDRATGLLVAPGDQTALSDALLCLLAQPEERARLGAAARHRFIEEFTDSRFAERVLTLYRTRAGLDDDRPGALTPG